ncbi:MAG: hypothetical protein EOP21_04045 [Hyphomicrobiales bacterium]|nr:MAG: hypothetical protein EOP21_04045 [Hyphomicrobiales bacterium]
MMRLLCKFGLHRWQQQPARLNPHRIVRRCRRCYCVSVLAIKQGTGAI